MVFEPNVFNRQLICLNMSKRFGKAKNDKKSSSHSEPKENPFTKFEDLAFPLAVFVLVVGVIYLLPSWEAADYFVNIENATLSNDEVTVTLSYSAPWAGSCYITTDVRPEGAPKGEPETPAWDATHLIRQHEENDIWWVEKWVNVEVLPDRKDTKTFKYRIVPSDGTLEFDAELKCDDDSLFSTSALVIRS